MFYCGDVIFCWSYLYRAVTSQLPTAFKAVFMSFVESLSTGQLLQRHFIEWWCHFWGLSLSGDAICGISVHRAVTRQTPTAFDRMVLSFLRSVNARHLQVKPPTVRCTVVVSFVGFVSTGQYKLALRGVLNLVFAMCWISVHRAVSSYTPTAF